MSIATLHIRRWRNEILVAREHREPPRVRARFDDLTSQMAQTLASNSQDWFDSQDDQVILMKRLELDCELDLSRASDDLVRRWRPRFAKALLDAIAAGDAEIVRWPSRAAYRARYIHDLACGNATDAWYYRSFEGLQALPAANAIRTLLSEDRTLGHATLMLLDRSAWRHLALILTAREAERILAALAGDDDTSFDLDRAVALARDARSEVSVSTIPAVRALHLFGVALREQLAPARMLTEWLRVVAHATCVADRVGLDGFIEVLRTANLATLVRLEPSAEPDTWPWLQRPGWRDGVIDQLRTHATARSASIGHDERLHSPLAGSVLLLGELDGLLDEAVCEQLPSCEVTPRALAAWLVLAYSCGKNRIHAFLRDGMWREFFGLPPKLDGDTAAAWLNAHAAEPALAALSRRAADLARGNFLVVPFAGSDVPRMVEIDSSTGLWLRFTPERSDGATGGWRTRLRLARLTRNDARFLDAPLPLPPDWACFFTQCAQVLLRRFGYRLPGFAGTSLPHLHANVFSVPGSWDAEQGRMQLTRPPLYPLLNLTGVARGSVKWGGPPVRNVRLEFNG